MPGLWKPQADAKAMTDITKALDAAAHALAIRKVRMHDKPVKWLDDWHAELARMAVVVFLRALPNDAFARSVVGHMVCYRPVTPHELAEAIEAEARK